MYAKWVQCYRDLPILAEPVVPMCCAGKRAPARSCAPSEFLWQEGHTVHATQQEAEEETVQMLGVYREFAENVLAIPVITGQKSEKEKFAGADHTYTMEAMMLDGQALQMGTIAQSGAEFCQGLRHPVPG